MREYPLELVDAPAEADPTAAMDTALSMAKQALRA
jgi:hypothetical protein